MEKKLSRSTVLTWTVALLLVAVGCGNFIEKLTRSDYKKQMATVANIRILGDAYVSWLTDQVGAASAGKTIAVEDYSLNLTVDELLICVQPSYVDDVSLDDGWGHPLELYGSALGNMLDARVLLIRSPGRDGLFEGGEYEVGSFAVKDYDSDIVWADGYFVRWPEGTLR